MCMKLTRCHEDVTDMGSPLPQSDNCSPLTQRTPRGVGASNSRLFLWPSPLCCWQMYAPWSQTQCSDYAINSDSITLRGKVNSHWYKEHILSFSFSGNVKKAHRSYILSGLSLWHTCCQIQYFYQCIIMHWDWVETSLGLHFVVGIALCGRYCTVWYITYWWSG